MKASLVVLALCACICLAIPAGAAETLATGISAVAATTENPPHNVSVYISDARAATAERNWTSALLLTTRGLAWYPDNADLLCLQGYTYRKTGQYQKSVDAISEGILLDPKPVRYANRGYGYLALGNYTAALDDAEAGISLDAAYPASYGVKALALQGLGKSTEARAALEPALALDPQNAHYWNVNGLLLSAGGNCTGAREALERSLALDPGYDLPYPGFTGALSALAGLNASCVPAHDGPTPAGSSFGTIAVLGIAGALLLCGMRK
ncbi:MAG TPA: tetratricopeptide repeat protein [Methanoregula sp.]|nr:tetratricopeptide repeat protein [Methanoregula sp.]